MFGAMKKTQDETTTPGAAVADPAVQRRIVLPRCDVRETSEAIIVVADVPGVDQQGIEITLDRGVLTLRATPTGDEPDGFQPLLTEYEAVAYERAFTLPDAIDADRVAAAVANGVLTLTLPKSAAAKPRRIAVKPG